VAGADPAELHTGRTGSTTRIDDFVHRGPEFDGIYIYPPLLTACCQIVGGPFKLSGMRARTLKPGAPMERLHVDVKYRANGWPFVGCILMIDAFDAENGATRFVPGTHLQAAEPSEVTGDPQSAHADEVLACGPAGSIIIFKCVGVARSRCQPVGRAPPVDTSSLRPTSRQQASPDDHSKRMRPETMERIGDLAKYVLNVGTSTRGSRKLAKRHPAGKRSGDSRTTGVGRLVSDDARTFAHD
jgi:hypothetical protein